MPNGTLTDADYALIAREVETFLPDRIFDAHAHLFCQEQLEANSPAYQFLPARIGLAAYYDCIQQIHPNERTIGGLFFGLAFNGDRVQNNAFVAGEIAGPLGGSARAQMIVSPDMTAEQVYDSVRNSGFVGLKMLSYDGDRLRPNLASANRSVFAGSAGAGCR